MKIEISAKEYRNLLDLLHIADVVVSGHRREEDKRFDEHRELIQKFYAFARAEGLGRLISRNDGTNRYEPTGDFERSTLAHAALDHYGDHLFWDQLIARLSERDVAQAAGGSDRLNAMSDSERRHMEGYIRQRYVEEFSANGVANLAVIDRYDAVVTAPVKTSD